MELTDLYKRTLIVIVPLSLLSALIEPKRLPLGIFFGGLLGLINIRGLKRGVENLMGAYGGNSEEGQEEGGRTTPPTGRLIFMSFFRLFLLAAIIILLAASRLINLIGLLVGFTVVFTLLLFEGLKASR